MKSAKLIDGKVKIIDVNKPVLNAKGAIIKVIGCGLCGSDLVKIKHATKENEQNIILGHEVVGRIEEINTDIKNYKIGDIVALGHHYPCLDTKNCDFCKNKSYSMCPTFKKSNIFPSGFSEYIKVDENHLKYTVYKMNSSLKEDEKAFLEPLSCCIRAIKRAGFEYGIDNKKYNTLTIGLGSIGLLMMKALKAFDVNAYGFDISQDRMNLALEHGFKFDENKKYDCIFLTAGNSKAIKTALDCVINGGKIIVFSSVELDEAGFSNNDIYYRELSIISSYSPGVEDIELSSILLNEKKVDVAKLSTYYSLDNLEQAVNDSFNNKVFKAYIKI
ncbi:MAG: alcohol dehydrogenase catalytic domain-containing protein [Candidatus Gastranaerophilales bacterium]|nr:alcohol dehydrogenase catalytic domain-containing protein [Candidatus Gastranaerophilales bacterium]